MLPIGYYRVQSRDRPNHVFTEPNRTMLFTEQKKNAPNRTLCRTEQKKNRPNRTFRKGRRTEPNKFDTRGNGENAKTEGRRTATAFLLVGTSDSENHFAKKNRTSLGPSTKILCFLATEDIRIIIRIRYHSCSLFIIPDVRVPARNRVEPLRAPRLGQNSIPDREISERMRNSKFFDDQTFPEYRISGKFEFEFLLRGTEKKKDSPNRSKRGNP